MQFAARLFQGVGHQGKMNLCRTDLSLCIVLTDLVPKIRICIDLAALRCKDPGFAFISDRDCAPKGQRAFKALQQQEREPDFKPPRLLGDLPIVAEPPAARHGRQYGGHFALVDHLIGGRRSKGDAEKADSRAGVVNTVADQLHFGAWRTVGHGQKLNPIADGTDWTDKVMANARPDECCKIWTHYEYLTLKGADMDDMNAILEPGMLVTHPQEPDWGVGQVQSNIAGRITVNFRETGKVVIDGSRVILIPYHG